MSLTSSALTLAITVAPAGTQTEAEGRAVVSKKYLGDYRLENIPDGRGGVKAAPVYCGKLFRFSLPPERVRQLRLSRVLLAAACTLALLVPLLLTAEGGACAACRGWTLYAGRL